MLTVTFLSLMLYCEPKIVTKKSFFETFKDSLTALKLVKEGNLLEF